MGTLIKPTEGMNPDFSFGFDDFITRDFFNWRRLKKMEQTDIPAANIRETKSSFEIELAAPGMKKDDFNIEIQDGLLTVSGKSKKSSIENSENCYSQEFSFREFNRSFTLPENMIQQDKIRASYVDGILKVTMPRIKDIEPTSPRKIGVK